MKKIQAAVARAKSAPFSIETIEVGDLLPHEVLVQVHATGICHTDLAMRDQTFPVPQPIVLGHEGSGVVAASRFRRHRSSGRRPCGLQLR